MHGAALLLVLLFATILILPQVTYAGGTGGPSGDGDASGCGTGYYYCHGAGWYSYGLNSGGPNGGFRDGTTWVTVRSKCSAALADSVWVYVIRNKAGSVRSYNFTWLEGTRIAGTPTGLAVKDLFDKGKVGDTTGLNFGVNVGWFCYSSAAATTISPSSTVVPSQVYPGGSAAFTHNMTASGPLKGSAWSLGPPSFWYFGNYIIDRYLESDPSNIIGETAGGIHTDYVTGVISAPALPISRGITISSLTSEVGKRYCEKLTLYSLPNGQPAVSSTICVLVIAPPTCQDPSASNYGGTLPCTHPPPLAATVAPYSYPSTNLAEPGDTVTFTHGVTSSTNLTFNVNYQWTKYNSTATGTIMVNGGVNSNTFSIQYDSVTIPNNATIGSVYCEYLSLNTAPAGVTIGNPNPSTACVRVVARPIVDFNGLDVNFCTNPAAPAASVGSVHTWAKLKDGAYVGSSSQYALFIYNAISGDGADKKGFFTGATTAVTNPKKLTFANTGANVFGLDWGDATPCTDYFKDEYGTSGEKLPVPLPAGIESYPSSQSIYGRTIPVGENRTIYVKGNATITGNITYVGSGWTLDNIPSFRLIVSGNIYINPGVTQLDGFYFAGGNIYTCTNGASATFPGYSTCTGQLTVNGAFEALGSIKYWRTGGTLNLAAPAETFSFSPEMFLSQWMGSNSSSQNPIQSIKSMPPVF